jgi:hypothetical protein
MCLFKFLCVSRQKDVLSCAVNTGEEQQCRASALLVFFFFFSSFCLISGFRRFRFFVVLYQSQPLYTRTHTKTRVPFLLSFSSSLRATYVQVDVYDGVA